MLSAQSKKKFVLLLVAFGTLLLLARIAATFQAENVIIRNLTRIELQKEAKEVSHIAKTLELRFAGLEEKINLIALNSDIHSGSPEICSQKVKEVTQVLHSKLSNFGRVLPNRIVDCSVNENAIGTTTTGIVAMDEVFNTQKLTLGRIRLSPILKTHSIALLTPVFKNGQFSGAVGGSISLTDLREYYFSPFDTSDSRKLILVDDNGDILVNPDTSIVGKNLLKEEVVDKRIVEAFKKTLNGENQSSSNLEKGVENYLTASTVNIFPNRNFVVISLASKDEVSKRVAESIIAHGEYSIFFYLRVGAIVATLLTLLAIATYVLKKFFAGPGSSV